MDARLTQVIEVIMTKTEATEVVESLRASMEAMAKHTALPATMLTPLEDLADALDSQLEQ